MRGRGRPGEDTLEYGWGCSGVISSKRGTRGSLAAVVLGRL